MLSEGIFGSQALSAIMGEVFNRAGKNFLVLTISDKESEKYLVFEENEITLLSLGPRKQALLGDLLVKTGLISEDNLTEALQEQRQSKDFLGNILVSQSVITNEQIKEALVGQVFEEIFDLITWDKAYYQFDEHPKRPDFTDPTIRMTKCEYNTHLLAVEICKQLEHWERVRNTLPNVNEVYHVNKSANAEQTNQLNSFETRILDSIDGLTPISHLVSSAGMSMFRCYLAIDRLLEFNLIVPTPSDELRDIAETLSPGHPATIEWNLEECADAIEHDELIRDTVKDLSNVFVLSDAGMAPDMKNALKREDPGGAISILLDGKHNVERVIRQTSSNELDVCRVLGRMLRSSLIRPATPRELKDAATDVQIEGDLDTALALLEWVYTHNQDDPELLQDLAIVTAAKGNRRLAAFYYKRIAEISREAFDYERAIMALSRVAELTPENYEINSMLAAVYLLRGEEYRESALTEFGQTLAKLTICGLYEQSQRVVDDIVKLIPNDEELKTQLMDLTLKITSTGASTENICPNCKATVDPDAKECSTCGAHLVHQCMTCGAEVKIGTFICPGCGKDPYSLPSKGQKGYTLRIKRAEGGSGFVRFKLLDALEKTRNAVSENRFSQAIETIQEAQKLQPYNEALKTELEEIKKLANEHEQHQQQIIEDTTTVSYKKHFLKRIAIIMAVVLVLCTIAGAAFLFFVDSGKEGNDWSALVIETSGATESTNKEVILKACERFRQFIREYPDSEFKSAAERHIEHFMDKYEKIAFPLYLKIEPLIKELKDVTPEDYIASLKKDEIEKIAEKISQGLSDTGNFLEDFPKSERVTSVTKLQTKLQGIESFMAKFIGSDLIEKNADTAYEAALKKAESDGYEVALEKFESIVKNFKDTGAAIKAANTIREFETYLAQHKECINTALAHFSAGKFESARNILGKFTLKPEYSKGTKSNDKHHELLRKIEENRAVYNGALEGIQKRWTDKALSVIEYRNRLQQLKNRFIHSGWEYSIDELTEQLEENILTAKNYKKRAEELIANRRYSDAYQFQKHLIEMSHKFIPLDSIVFYVTLDSLPTHATVSRFDGMTTVEINTTPCTVEVPYSNGEGTSVFILTKKGYGEKRVVLSSRSILAEDKLTFIESLVSTFSEKWSLLNTPLSTMPMVVKTVGRNSLIYVESRSLNFLDLKNGNKLQIPLVTPGARMERPSPKNPEVKTIGDTLYWSLKIPPKMENIRVDKLNGDYIVVAGSDGKISIIDPVSRTLVESFGLKHKYNIISNPVFIRLSHLVDHQMVYFAANNGVIYCYDMNTHDFRWQYETGHMDGGIKLHKSKHALIATLSTGKLLCLSYGGNIIARSGILIGNNFADRITVKEDLLYTIKGGNLYVWSITMNKMQLIQTYRANFNTLDSHLVVLGDRVIAYDKQTSQIMALEKARKIWDAKLPKEILPSTLTRYKNWLIVPLVDGDISIVQIDSGEITKTILGAFAFEGRITVHRNKLLIATSNREIKVIDIQTNTVWKNTDVAEKIIGLFAIDNDIIVVTISHVYRFEGIIKRN